MSLFFCQALKKLWDICVFILTFLFLLLDKTAVMIAAYCFALFGSTAFFGSFFLIAKGNKSKYITNASFVLQAYSYYVINLSLNVIFVLLEKTKILEIPVGWFCFLHSLVFAFFAWRIIAMDAGQAEIARVGQKVKLKTYNWKSIEADIIALKEIIPVEITKELQTVIETIRYADPMSCAELESLDEEIKATVLLLESCVDRQQYDNISSICLKIQRQIKNRNIRTKLLK